MTEYEDIKTAIMSHLCALTNDEERTVRFITNMISCQFPGITRTTISEILYDCDKFIPRNKPNDYRVYWFLDDHDIEETLARPGLEGRIYVFVDCDNSPDLFYFLSDIINPHDHLYIRGYAYEGHNMLDTKRYMIPSIGLDEKILFRQIEQVSKLKPAHISTTLTMDLISTLQTHYDATCFVISTNKTLTASVDELQNQFMESDLCTGVDSEVIRNRILSCI